MLKSILEKAIGEFKPHDDSKYDAIFKEGYNLAKAEMRAKIPQVVEEVRKLLQGNLWDYEVCEVGVDNLLGLTVENSAQKEDKEI